MPVVWHLAKAETLGNLGFSGSARAFKSSNNRVIADLHDELENSTTTTTTSTERTLNLRGKRRPPRRTRTSAASSCSNLRFELNFVDKQRSSVRSLGTRLGLNLWRAQTFAASSEPPHEPPLGTATGSLTNLFIFLHRSSCSYSRR